MICSANILVVDDDTSMLRSTVRMLGFLGFAAVPAESAKEALRTISNRPEIDLVITDIVIAVKFQNATWPCRVWYLCWNLTPYQYGQLKDRKTGVLRALDGDKGPAGSILINNRFPLAGVGRALDNIE
jgi:hypothetical protein